MYESLLLKAGGEIIFPNQVASRQGDANVMIGIGGTGIAALKKLKKAIHKCDNIKFLAIDTDDYGVAISPTEQFSIHEPNLYNLLANPDRLRNEPNLKWMNVDNIKMTAFTQGAGGVRQVGRYCLMKKSNDLKDKLSKLIVEAKAAAGTAKVNVHIFAGLSGGTGSGCFIDVCYIVREILKTMSGNVFGYFFLPDVHLHRKGIMGQEAIENWNKANGYAALKELNYLMSIPFTNETFEADYGEFVIKSKEAPVDHCYLISGTNSYGVSIANAYDYALNVVVDYVLTYLSTTINNSLMVNVAQTDRVELENQIRNAVRKKADPSFWNVEHFLIDASNSDKDRVMFISNVATVIGMAVEREFGMESRNSNVGDQVTCLKVVRNIPLYEYECIFYNLKRAYERTSLPGLHLHERDINWKETLPNLKYVICN